MRKDKVLTMNSRVGDVYDHPIGHDIIAKILMQTGMSETMINNPVVRNMRLFMLVKPAHKFLDDAFWDTFLHLLNQEKDRPVIRNDAVTPQWWKEAVFYQIYPRTFCDTNGDGVGDIQGILSKLDYLKQLGVDAIWLSPIYDSPMDDNGYDIRDYHKISSLFGTTEDFDTLLEEVHQRDMKLIMDLVVNHTSDEHPYFQDAIQNPDSPYRNYYFIRNHSNERPNNWNSFFEAYAWDQYGENKDWALHLFSRKQIDLNWDYEPVRTSVKKMINWWLEKGVDGFRLDVINYISKAEGLPQGNESVGKLMGYTGIEHYYYGPHLHQYLKEINRDCFSRYNAFSIGETPGVGIEMGKLISGESRRELDMIFSFDHLETPGHVRFEAYDFDLNAYRDYLLHWYKENNSDTWLSLFYNNHDNPRMVSKIDSSGVYRKAIAQLLAVMQFTLPGTPFIYQGDEMGLMNIPFQSIDELNDVESIQYYKQHIEAGENPKDVWKTVYAGTRDHARVMLPWEKNQYGQYIDEEITNTYRSLIALRKQHPCLVYGDMECVVKKNDRFVYIRKDDNDEFLIDCNLGKMPVRPFDVDITWTAEWPKQIKGKYLGPYGVRVWKKIKRDTE